MTTAARPTFDPARGKDSKAPSFQYGARDLASHTQLKFRQPGQGGAEEIGSREELLEELREAEQGKHDQEKEKLLAEAEKLAKLDKEESDESEEESSDEDDDDDDDDDDNAAELLATLQRIRKERAEEKERQDRETKEDEDTKKQQEAMAGNPLLNIGDEKRDFSVKRRWDDDVVFKNQARGMDDKPKKRFINDMLRSDFHRKFLHKYIH
ncbi:unnamed protein product [Rhizopus stolonifer]